MRLSPSSAKGAWGRSSRPAIPVSIGPSPSKCSRRAWPRIPFCASASSARRATSRASNTRTSVPCSTSASTRVTSTSSCSFSTGTRWPNGRRTARLRSHRPASQGTSPRAAPHRSRTVPRDPSPGNIMITRTGARLLDFGLARQVPGAATLKTTIGDRSDRMAGLTTEGTILGTLSYMAPEQIDGREVDTRADVFAFGAVLFEMLTGMKAFEGETPARVMSAILRDEPARVSSIVPVTPAALEALIHACLAKDPNERWQNTSDVARQLRHLRDMMSGPKSGAISASGAPSSSGVPSASAQAPATGKTRRNLLPYAGWLAAAIFAAAALGLLVARTRTSTPSAAAPLSLHSLLLPPEGMYLTDTLALSPDGRRLAFVAAEPTGRKHLWVRALDSRTPQSLANTDGASEPFWSPDGQQIAFFANGRLNRVAATGGAVTAICQAGTTAGGSWNREDVIVFAQQDGPMLRVAASGGRPEPLTTFDRNLGETHHLYPTFLPDGRHYTYYVNSRERGVYVGELGSTTRTRLFDPDPALPAAAAVTPAIYAPTGHILYVRDRVLMARRFDLASLAVSGEPTTLVQTVDYDPPGQAAFTVAEGLLVYRASQHRPVADLVWVDRAGKPVGAIESPPGAFRTIALSPDGRTVAVDRRDAQGLPSVWLVDTARGTSSRLTTTYWSGDPLWSPDGRILAYSVAADSPPNLVIRGDRGQGAERRLLQQPSEIQYATSFTPDGRQIIYSALTATTGSDIYAVSATDDHPTPQRLLQTSANEGQGRVSPDGRWLVYMSDESGQPEVYASRFPEMQGKVTLSSGGGSRPFWRADGKEVFFLHDGHVVALPVAPSATGLSPGKAEELFKVTLCADVYTPDASGQRFLIARPAATTEIVPLEILLNPLR